MDWSKKSASRGQVGRKCECRKGVLVRARRVSELDSDWLSGALWDRPVELLYGTFSFTALVKPDEAYTFGKACKKWWGRWSDVYMNGYKQTCINICF